MVVHHRAVILIDKKTVPPRGADSRRGGAPPPAVPVAADGEVGENEKSGAEDAEHERQDRRHLMLLRCGRLGLR